MIVINGHRVEQVRQFMYLGSAIKEDCKCHEEVKRRIAIGKEAFSKRGELLRGKMKLKLKKRMMKTDLEYGIVCRRNVDVEQWIFNVWNHLKCGFGEG